jgi:Family of unknown function (DUF6636)
MAGLAALAAPAWAADVFVTIKTPTGNISCAYSRLTGQPAVLRCDIRSGLVPRPPRPKGCALDWAYGYEMRTTGRAHTFCAGDTVLDARARVVGYGRSWTRGGFTCVSRRTGLTCRNRSGHGFVLSRKHSRTF